MFLFFSVNLDAVLSGSTQKISPTFVKLKFETVWIHFLSDILGLQSSRNFATMATWRNDFYSLASPVTIPKTIAGHISAPVPFSFQSFLK